jgi:peroxiredoxin
VVKKNGVTFPVVTDKDNAYAAELNLDFVLPEKLQEIYKKIGIDLERFNGNNTWVLPMAARFIVDKSGIIREAVVNLDHTLRPEPEEIPRIIASMT